MHVERAWSFRSIPCCPLLYYLLSTAQGSGGDKYLVPSTPDNGEGLRTALAVLVFNRNLISPRHHRLAHRQTAYLRGVPCPIARPDGRRNGEINHRAVVVGGHMHRSAIAEEHFVVLRKAAAAYGNGCTYGALSRAQVGNRGRSRRRWRASPVRSASAAANHNRSSGLSGAAGIVGNRKGDGIGPRLQVRVGKSILLADIPGRGSHGVRVDILIAPAHAGRKIAAVGSVGSDTPSPLDTHRKRVGTSDVRYRDATVSRRRRINSSAAYARK